MKKKFSYLFLLMLLLPITNVMAVTYSSGSTCYRFNKSNGTVVNNSSSFACTNVSGYVVDAIKKLDNKNAYCSEWKSSINNTSYSKDSGWNSNNKNAIIMGFIIDEIYEDKTGVAAYALTAATLNTYNRRVLKNNQAYDYYNSIADVKKYYDAAVKKYNDLKIGVKNLPALKFAVSDKVMNYTSANTFISEKITLSNADGKLDANYGGASDKVTYNVTASTTLGTVQICTGANGTGCSASKSISQATAYSFYVKVSGVTTTSNDNISVTVKATGSNSTSYPSVARYKSDSSSQKLLVHVDGGKVSRSVTQSLILSVPDVNQHRITGYKVDNSGANLTGAVLEIYKDDANVAANKLATSASGKSYVVYNSPKTGDNADDFFNHNYYLVEKNAPDGYVLSSSVNEILIKGTNANTSRSVCYHNGGTDSDAATVADSADRCDFDNFVNMCKNDTTNDVVALTEEGNCNFPAPETPTGTEGGTTTGDGTGTGTGGGTTTGEGTGTEGGTTTGGETTPSEGTGTEGGTTTGGETGGETPTTPTTPTVTYTKVCVSKKNSNAVVDNSWCDDKGNYTLVRSSKGNVTVTRSNVKNKVVISKKAVTGDDEVAGATLKICDKASFDAKKNDCVAAKTIDDVELSWTSGNQPQEWNGLKKGTYYIVETVPPAGYIVVTTAVEFSIDEYGTVKTGGTEILNSNIDKNPIVFKNTLNTVTISKTDVATSKELPGATISICETYFDDETKTYKPKNDQYTNECISTVLADGSEATWKSETKPHVVSGLSSGTYMLVEKIAPDGYSTAEAIIFTMKDDGTLTDKDGKSLKDSKIVMHDKKLQDVKTGSLGLYLVFAIIVGACAFGVGSYYKMNKKKTNI